MSSTYLLRTHNLLVYFRSFPQKGYGVIAPCRNDGQVEYPMKYVGNNGSDYTLLFNGVPKTYPIDNLRGLWRVLMYNGFANVGKVQNTVLDGLDENG